MAVPFSNTKLRPPPGFRNILLGLSREVLRSQPKDIYAFGTLYLEQLLKIRKESGFDPSQVGADIEDRYYNKVFKGAGERLGVEQKAALKIQTAYRRYRAVLETEALRKNRAALKIQAGFIGFLARKKVKHMRAGLLTERDKAKRAADLEDAEDIDKYSEFPAITCYQDAVNDPNEKAVSLDTEPSGSSTRDSAIERIQAGFQGMLARQFTEPPDNDGKDDPCVLADANPDLEDYDLPHMPGETGVNTEVVHIDLDSKNH